MNYNIDIYLTDIETGERMRFPLLPDELQAKGSANMITMNIIATGEVKIPRGSKLVQYSWSGIFPGEHMKNLLFLREWQRPITYVNTLCRWYSNAKKLRLMLTESPVNVDVYIQDFTYKAKGGNGEYEYSITLVDARTVTVNTVAEAGIETDTLSKMISAHYVAIRPANYAQKYITHTVVLGDTLYSIAKKYLGSGEKWETIYNLNKEMIDAANKGKAVSKDTIYVGQVLLIKENPNYVEPEKKNVSNPEADYDYGNYSGSGGGYERSGSSSGSTKQTSSGNAVDKAKASVALAKAAIAAASNNSSKSRTASAVQAASNSVRATTSDNYSKTNRGRY